MSRSLKVHERKDTVKWVLVALALLLVGAILCGLMTDWFREWNPFCWFGHNYGDDGKCSRCGADKPAEEPKPEPEEQALLAIPMTFYASANSDDSGISTRAVGDAGSVNFSFDEETRIITFTPGSKIKSWNYKIMDKSKTQTYLSNSYEGHDVVTVDLSDYFPDTLHYNETYVIVVEQVITTLPLTKEYELLVHADTPLPEAPTKTGYTFTGWYTDEACTNKYTEDYVTGDITLYAGFQAHTYSIKFNANSGSGTMDNLSMTYDTAKALTANGFTKEHYSFAGWATSADGDVVYANNAEVNNLTTEDNATVELFAKWERSEVCVTFVSDSETVATTWIAIGTKATLPETPVKEGHLFNGWYYEDGSKYMEQNISEDITLTAKFDIIRCTVTFMVDGEVYAVYVCDWGTSIAQALNGAGVNTVLYKADEHSGNF